jgi:hypothetical protein
VDPLEEAGGFGLTPWGTYQRFGTEILDWVGRPTAPAVGSYGELRFEGEEPGMQKVAEFLRELDGVPRREWPEAELRELWVLLGSWEHLFLAASRR